MCVGKRKTQPPHGSAVARSGTVDRVGGWNTAKCVSVKEKWLGELHLEPLDRLPFWPKRNPAYGARQAEPFCWMFHDQLHEWIGNDRQGMVTPVLKESRRRTLEPRPWNHSEPQHTGHIIRWLRLLSAVSPAAHIVSSNPWGMAAVSPLNRTALYRAMFAAGRKPAQPTPVPQRGTAFALDLSDQYLLLNLDDILFPYLYPNPVSKETRTRGSLYLIFLGVRVLCSRSLFRGPTVWRQRNQGKDERSQKWPHRSIRKHVQDAESA